MEALPRKFPFTAVAVALIAVLILFETVLGNVDIIAIPIDVLVNIEKNRLDDIIIVILLPLVGVATDQVLATKRAEREVQFRTEQLRVVKVTMRTVQDIVNNGLNQLQLLRLEAEGRVPPETLALFDQAIEETVARMKALGDLDTYAEKQMALGTGLGTSKEAAHADAERR